MYQVSFLVAQQLAVSVIVGTAFMNRHVRGIMCMDREIWLTRSKIPILSPHQRQRPYAEVPSESLETDGDRSIRRDTENVNRSHVVKLSKAITVEPMSQVAVPVTTEASGLVFIEPMHSVLARYCVRTANGVAEVKRGRPFTIVLSNFSDQPRRLQKNMTIGYATRNPIGVYCLTDETSRSFESVLNLPLGRKDDSPQRVEEADAGSKPESSTHIWVT